jgi:hypothetical protein
MMQQFLATWAMNTNGIMPYWTTLNGSGDAWRRANPMAVFYSGVNYAGGGKSLPLPIASVRMKIMRRCQQDIEYLHLLAGTAGWDRPRARRALLPLSDQPDSPVLSFSRLSSQQWLQLRQDLMATLAGGKK